MFFCDGKILNIKLLSVWWCFRAVFMLMQNLCIEQYISILRRVYIYIYIQKLQLHHHKLYQSASWDSLFISYKISAHCRVYFNTLFHGHYGQHVADSIFQYILPKEYICVLILACFQQNITSSGNSVEPVKHLNQWWPNLLRHIWLTRRQWAMWCLHIYDKIVAYSTRTCCFIKILQVSQWLTHWGRVMHIYISKLTIIGSDDGLSPGRRQAIIRTNAGILLNEPLRTNFIHFHSRKCIWKYRLRNGGHFVSASMC